MNSKENTLNVLMVAARYSPYIGGLETHVQEVSRRLTKLGVNVTILTTMPYSLSTPLPKEEVVDGVRIIRVHSWPANTDYHFAPAIYRIITSGQWDIVHSQGYHTLVAPLGMFAAWRANIPYVVAFHSGGDSSRFRKALRWLQRLAVRPLLAPARRLICPSQWEVEFFHKHLHFPYSQFAVIPNGAHHLPQRHTDAAPQPKDGRLIVSIGRLERYKGHHLVIAALPKVLEYFPDVRLRILGVGPYEMELKQLVSELHLTEQVEVRGIPPGDGGGVAAVIEQADLVTLLSEHEAQGIAVLEALSIGRPVLVANTSALQEFADLGLARSVPITQSSEVIAMAIVQQIRDPLFPKHVQLPTWDKCTEDVLAIYLSITGKSLLERSFNQIGR